MSNNEGPKLWKKAKSVIPGGSQLLSKRSELFLPEYWPSYYEKAKGIEIWNLDGTKYTDMSLMGIGACILGYADDEVDKAVMTAIKNGSASTLNCHEEVELAELLLKIDPWAGMVRFSRSGGEAASIAVRIARAASGKDKVAFCGYHGWHDWYLASNLSDQQNLDGHLLPGLQPKGVPRVLKGTSIPFNYNDLNALKTIIDTQDIGTVIMEPIRNFEPKDNFLNEVRKLTEKKGIILIIDEISSGWRLTKGGAYKLYNFEPDITVYAKAMSNGYPMSAIVGKSSVMDAAQESFISSTHWTERIGPTAAIATINKMIERDVPSHITKMGKQIKNGWKKLSAEHNINLRVFGIDPMPHFEFDYQNMELGLKTYFTQEMLKKNYLASNGVYLSYSHSTEDINEYLEQVDSVFKSVREIISNNNLKANLEGPVAQTGFKRLA